MTRRPAPRTAAAPLSVVVPLTVVVLLALAGCTLGELPSAPPSATAVTTPTPTVIPATPTPAPTATPSPTPAPTPNPADVPIFQAGTQLKALATLHLRDLPGTSWGTQANLPAGALVEVVLGPIRTDGFGWYLVRDVDPAPPTFTEAWVAAGYAPNAFLAPATATATPQPGAPLFVVGYAETTSGDFGPFQIQGSTALRWAVALPNGAQDGASCTFTGSIKPANGQPVVFLATTISQAPIPGTTQPSFFAGHPTLTGDLFIHVDSDCSWAVTVVQLPL